LVEEQCGSEVENFFFFKKRKGISIDIYKMESDWLWWRKFSILSWKTHTVGSVAIDRIFYGGVSPPR